MKQLFLCLLVCLTYQVSAQMTPTHDDILIPVRDGKFLEADVYIPNGTTTAEVILIQTPYNKNLYSNGLPLGIIQNLNSQPYIWVIVDWRGFYGSQNAAVAQPNRGKDGYDICEWISQQIWFASRIGTWGPSALGGVQYNTMVENHPNYTCAVPQVATGHQAYDSYFYGGVLEKARLNQLEALGYGLSPIVMANTYNSNIWTTSAANTWFPSAIKIPTLQIGGWYDHNIDKMMGFYKDSRSLAASDVQDEQYLLVGPWVHGGTGAAYVGSAIQGE
jgi:predicted acyl esterase